MKTHHFISAVFLFVSTTLAAQSPDKIVTVSNDTMEVFVTEVSEKAVSFRLQNTNDAPILKMPTRRIKQLESQRVGNHDFTYGNPRLQRRMGVAIGGESQYDEYFGGISFDYFNHYGFRFLAYLGGMEYSEYDIRLGLLYHIDSKYNTTKLSPYVGFVAGTNQISDYLNLTAGIMYNFSPKYFADLSVSRAIVGPENTFVDFYPLIGLRVGYRW